MYTTMLELTISMVFLFLMLSAASSAIQEIIANLGRWRAKTLENGIKSLLRDKDVTNDVTKALYDLPLFQGLCSPNASGNKVHKPSYIPSSTFALAMLQLMAPKAGSTDAGQTTLPKETTELLQSLLRGTTTVEEQRKRLEDWFDNSMDRISGWYKRKSHAFLWIIGILLCLLVNADSISLANAFWNDQVLRSAMVAAATKYVENPPKQETSSTGNTSAGQNTGKSHDAAQTSSATGGDRSTNAPPQNKSHSPSKDQSAPTVKKPGSQGVGQSKKDKKDNSKAPAQTGNNSGAGGGTNGGSSSAQGLKTGDTPFKRLDDVRKELTSVNIPLGWCWTLSGNEGEVEKKCFPIFNPAKPRPKDVKATFSNTGKATYYYWVVAQYKDGKSSPSLPFVATNAPDSLSEKSSIEVSWHGVQDARSYDILRTPDSNLPPGECVCAVAKGFSGQSFGDKSATLQNYTVEASNPTEQATLPDPRMILSFGSCRETILWWWWKIVGIALTALAISQGAPFWFDLLQKAVRLRLAGDAPDEKKKK